MLVVILIFSHQALQLGGKLGWQILQKYRSVKLWEFRMAIFITKLTSAASLLTIAISLSHINSPISLISMRSSFFLLSDHSMVKHSHSYLLINTLLSLLKFLTPFHMISVTQSWVTVLSYKSCRLFRSFFLLSTPCTWSPALVPEILVPQSHRNKMACYSYAGT